MSKESSSLIPKLYDFLSVENIDEAKVYFETFGKNGLSYNELREYLTQHGIVYSDDVFENVCSRIDMDRDSRIKFNEFIAYFITELQNDDNAAERLSIIPPIPKSTKVVPTMVRNRILRIFYIPPSSEMTTAETTDSNATRGNGCYITVGWYGDAYLWSDKWKLEAIFFVGR